MSRRPHGRRVAALALATVAELGCVTGLRPPGESASDTTDSTGGSASATDGTGDASGSVGGSGSGATTSDTSATATGGDPPLPPLGACELPPAEPAAIVITTTDFSTGAVSVLELGPTPRLTTDVALGTPDAIPYPAPDGRVVVVHRFGWDYLDVLDPRDGWRSLANVRIEGPAPGVAANPHAIAFDRGGRAWVTLYGAAEVQALALPAAQPRARVDLRPFADGDGLPEVSLAVVCGERLYVGVQRLDRRTIPWGEAGPDVLVAIDPRRGEVLDLDPSTAAPDGVVLQGRSARQLRADPRDPSGTRLFALTDGVELVDLAAATAAWVVRPEQLAARGYGGPQQHLLPQAFDIDAAGATLWLTIYRPDFSGIDVLRIPLAAPEAASRVVPELELDGVERTIELVGDVLVVGSRASQRPGVWLIDTGAQPPAPLTAAPLSTGLPPYAFVGIAAAPRSPP